jgi:hypothetical protein
LRVVKHEMQDGLSVPHKIEPSKQRVVKPNALPTAKGCTIAIRGSIAMQTSTSIGDGEDNDTQTGMPSGIPEGAMCVQRFDDSLNSAIHITFRISLRSSSMPEPRDPLLKVLFCFLFLYSDIVWVEKSRWWV